MEVSPSRMAYLVRSARLSTCSFSIICWRYDSIAQSIGALTEKSGGTLAMNDLHSMMKDVQFDSLTVHTILFKPADWSLDVYRMRPDHLASEDPGVHIPAEILFPW